MAVRGRPGRLLSQEHMALMRDYCAFRGAGIRLSTLRRANFQAPPLADQIVMIARHQRGRGRVLLVRHHV